MLCEFRGGALTFDHIPGHFTWAVLHHYCGSIQVMKSVTRDAVVGALGAARMAPYLSAADGNKKRALALYRWSVELGASVQVTLGITEVLVRNAMNEKLQEWNRRETGNPSWLLDAPASPLRGLTQGKRREALRRARKSAGNRSMDHPRYGAEITHDDALANTMFGMWKDILPNLTITLMLIRRRERTGIVFGCGKKR